jgi:hypothetical protein
MSLIVLLAPELFLSQNGNPKRGRKVDACCTFEVIYAWPIAFLN